MTTEAALRDYLSEHLELIEPGLTLIKTEFKLPNPLGAKGFTDILARDHYGHTVVIELKRSDIAARSAINELYKYIALLRTNHGLGIDSIRCIVASTHWHELLVPFSEFCNSVQYAVEGRHILLDQQGVPVALKPVEPRPQHEPLRICPDHMAFCFGDADRRAQGLAKLLRTLEHLRVRDYLTLELERQGECPEGYLPFIIYVALGKVGFEARIEVEQHLSPSAKAIIEECEDIEDEPEMEWGIENAILSDLALAVSAEETSASGPDHLVGLLRNWALIELGRGGRFESKDIYRDEALLSRLGGLDGASSVAFSAICSPRHKPAWNATRERLKHSLFGNEVWLKGLHWFMQKAEANAKNSLSLQVFNPMNLLRVLRDLHTKADPSVRPYLQAVLECEQAPTLSVLHGELIWDEVTHPQNPAHILSETCQEVFNSSDPQAFFIAMATNGVWQLEAELLARHGLRYALAEYQVVDGKISSSDELCINEKKFEKRSLAGRPLGNLPKFLQANRAYLDAIAEFFSLHTLDLTSR